MRILFWGTPEFAVPALRALAGAGHRVVGVVTRPDRPRGRGRKLHPSAVKAIAEAEEYAVFTPERPSGGSFEGAIRAVHPDISVVVAFGCILERRILDIPRLGSFNLHASLLPELRGAAPIARAIERGHTGTGVSIMRMVEAMDAGPVLAQRSIPISPGDTTSGLSRRLADLGARLMVDVLARLEAGPVPEVEQDHDAATFAPKVDRRSARVDWGRDASAVANHIRAMDEVPGAWTRLRGMPVKLFGPRLVEDSPVEAVPGEIVAADGERGLLVATATGVLRIGEVQPAGKRRMDAAAWLRGRGPRTGDRFDQGRMTASMDKG